jgi:hypothetical protein
MYFRVPDEAGPLHFIHKRVVGAIGGVLTGGGIPGAMRGFREGGGVSPTGTEFGGFGGQDTRCSPGSFFDESLQSCRFISSLPANVVPGGANPFQPLTGGIRCMPPWRMNPLTGECQLYVGDRPGRDAYPEPGTAVVPYERLHAGDHVPFTVEQKVRRCLPGHVLGKDKLCHSKSDISNKNRLYPKPRRPLGTSGDLNAVSKASRFGRRLVANQNKLKNLEKDLKKVTGRCR